MTLASLRHAVEYWLFRLVRWKWTVLPEGAALRLASLIGVFAARVLRVRRAEVDEHIRVAFPERSAEWRDRIAVASYEHVARETAILFRMASWSPDELLARVHVEGREALRAAVVEHGGLVLLTAHVGNWEMAGAVTAASGFSLDVVGKGMANRRFERDLFAVRERLGMRVIEMSKAPKGVLRALGEGRIVAMLGDQNAHRSDLFVPFFGKAAATARGPALFAIRTGAPIFYGSVIRQSAGKRPYLATVRELAFERTGDLERDVRSLLEAYMTAIEETVRSAPEQYFWLHKRWKTRPAEELSPPR